ncbi:hypothetical protein ACFY9A_24195 [Streptomyces rubradiris]
MTTRAAGERVAVPAGKEAPVRGVAGERRRARASFDDRDGEPTS